MIERMRRKPATFQKAPWDWKRLEPSLEVACQFLLLGSWPSEIFTVPQKISFTFSLPDMKSCRALTLHFVWYPKKNKWDKSAQSGISNFSAHRTDWPFRLRPASKPGYAAMCMCWSPKLQFSSSWSFSHFMLDLQPAMVDVSSTFVAFTTPLNLAPHRWQTPYCSKGRALNPWTWFCTSLPLSFVFAGSDINLVAKNTEIKSLSHYFRIII